MRLWGWDPVSNPTGALGRRDARVLLSLHQAGIECWDRTSLEPEHASILTSDLETINTWRLVKPPRALEFITAAQFIYHVLLHIAHMPDSTALPRSTRWIEMHWPLSKTFPLCVQNMLVAKLWCPEELRRRHPHSPGLKNPPLICCTNSNLQNTHAPATVGTCKSLLRGFLKLWSSYLISHLLYPKWGLVSPWANAGLRSESLRNRTPASLPLSPLRC